MEAFKVENYEREHGTGTFVSFRHLPTNEAEENLQCLRQRLELPREFGGVQVVRILRDRSTFIEGFDATQDDFDLKQVLSHIKLDAADKVLVNWYRFDDIDELRAVDLCKIFGDIWYPSSDDIDVFDSSMNWLLSIHHDGSVWALVFKRH